MKQHYCSLDNLGKSSALQRFTFFSAGTHHTHHTSIDRISHAVSVLCCLAGSPTIPVQYQRAQPCNSGSTQLCLDDVGNTHIPAALPDFSFSLSLKLLLVGGTVGTPPPSTTPPHHHTRPGFGLALVKLAGVGKGVVWWGWM